MVPVPGGIAVLFRSVPSLSIASCAVDDGHRAPCSMDAAPTHQTERGTRESAETARSDDEEIGRGALFDEYVSGKAAWAPDDPLGWPAGPTD